MSEMRTEWLRLDGPPALALMTKAVAELNARYPRDAHTSDELDADEFAPPEGAFLVVHLDDQPAGCGALRRLEIGIAEVKRMYVEPWARRRGVGRRVLAELEAMAGRLGYRAVRLETGILQPEAIALYEKAGYRRVACYGEFIGNPLSVCLEKRITPSVA